MSSQFQKPQSIWVSPTNLLSTECSQWSRVFSDAAEKGLALNINELYEYIRQRTGLGWFHISFAEGITEFSEREADVIAECVESVCKMRAARKAEEKRVIMPPENGNI